MKFKQKTRSRFDFVSEFAGKQLPAHPITRYHTFSPVWKSTRKKGGYVPRPNRGDEDLFPCCLSCQVTTRGTQPSEPLWRKEANASWLRAEWRWDFGHTLPEGLIGYGVGLVPPTLIERDRIFVFDESTSRQYLDVLLEEHALLGDIQHEAKVSIFSSPSFGNVNFEGQMVASVYGNIYVAIPRPSFWGDGAEIWQRFTFENIEPPYDLSSLVLRDDNIEVKDGKVFLKGIQL